METILLHVGTRMATTRDSLGGDQRAAGLSSKL